MGWIIGLFTVILVLDCLFLILLILVQLPKKEAGIGQAFGGGATDALFGAGSGTALTKMTKYATGFFLGTTLLLTVLNANQIKNKSQSFEQELNEAAKTLPAPTPPPAATNPLANAVTPTNAALTPATNLLTTASNMVLSSSNAPKLVLPKTNTAPATNEQK